MAPNRSNNPSPPYPLEQPEASALFRNPGLLRSLLQSPETRRLIQLLQKQGDLTSAAQQAKQGNPGALQAMLSRLQASQEGEAALTDLENRLNK